MTRLWVPSCSSAFPIHTVRLGVATLAVRASASAVVVVRPRASLRGEGGVEECGGFGARRTVANLPVAEFDDLPGPVSAKSQVGGNEWRCEGTDQRGERSQADARWQVAGSGGYAVTRRQVPPAHQVRASAEVPMCDEVSYDPTTLDR